MVKARTPDRLDAWLAAAASSGVLDLVGFADGLQREEDALRAALPRPWSTGPVGGQLPRLKLSKRQGDGRCGRATLKRRLLRAA